MMDMTTLLTRVVDFNEADAVTTRGELSAARRRRARVVETFKTFRQQIDIFEKSILDDYDAVIADANARITRLEGEAIPEAAEEPTDKDRAGVVLGMPKAA
jgi:hypothetical protein